MLPGVLARTHRSLRLRALDLADRVRGRTKPLVPPRRLNFVGPGGFVAVGDEFLRHLVELGGLRPTDRVLDIGCGIGRLARPLSGFLQPGGSYDGFDVSEEGIAWCRRHYRRFPQFRFEHGDVANAIYNPHGRLRGSEYAFPYPNGHFDLALAISVFTHLLEDDARRYLAEAARVLAPGGRLLTTWLLLDDETRPRIEAGEAALDLRDRNAETAVASEGTAEEAVAYDEAWVRARVAECGLDLRGVWPGTWSGREEGRSFQDIVLAVRHSSTPD